MIINIDVTYSKNKRINSKTKFHDNNLNNNNESSTVDNEDKEGGALETASNGSESPKKEEIKEENVNKDLDEIVDDIKGEGDDKSGNFSSENKDIEDTKKTGDENEADYEPETMFKPQHKKRNNLVFTSVEGELFETLKSSNDLGNKIYQTVFELSKLNVLMYPYATVCLYRTLIESATQYASKKSGAEYQETALPASIKNVLNTWSNSTKTSKEFKSNIGLWRDLVNKRDLLDKLNLYIHNVTPVDVDLILDTWQSMKGYIRECVKS